MNSIWTVLDSLAITAAVINQRGDIVDVNGAWLKYAQVNGSTQADWTGCNYLHICDTATGLSANDAIDVAAGIRSVLSGQATAYAKVYACHTPTAVQWYRMRATPWPLQSTWVLITHEDVTELQQAQDRVRRANHDLESGTSEITDKEQFVRSVTDSFPAMLGYWDRNLICHYANQAYRTWFNRSATEMLGISMQELMGETLFNKNKPYVQGVLAGEAQQFERMLVRTDGTPSYVLANYVPDKDLRGRVGGFFALVNDITEFKESENKLKLAEVAVQNTDEAIVIADANGVILSTNPAFTDITGIPASVAVGRVQNAFDRNLHDPALYEQIQHALETTGHWQGQLWNRHQDGHGYVEWKRINKVTVGDGYQTYYVSVFHDVTELWHQNEKNRHLAFYDALTDLPNRALLTERLTQLCAMLERDKRNLAVLFLDLDGFKGVNDRLGHPVGDEVLKAVAAILKQQVRSNDTVARLGGDEFVLLVDNALGREEVGQLAQRVVEAITGLTSVLGQPIQIGTSIGIAMYPTHGKSPQALLQAADAAMYAAKDAGKNGYRFALE